MVCFANGRGLQVAVTFLISGLLAGAFFTWITHLSLFEDFFFVPDRKLGHVARFSWWVATSLFFTIGLIVGFILSLRKINFVHKFKLTFGNSLLACILISSTMPFIRWFALSNLNVFGNWLGIIIPFLLIVPFSLAMCIVVRDLRKTLIAIPLTTLVIVLTTLAVSELPRFYLNVENINDRDIYMLEFTQWTVAYSIMSLYFGLWLIRREKRS